MHSVRPGSATLPCCIILSTLLGCAAQGEREIRRSLEDAGDDLDLDAVQQALEAPGPVDQPEPSAFDGTPERYVEHALAHHPGLQASWQRWRAATHRIARERRLPMPSLTYGVFVRQVETRVGPQRHRLSVRQRFPWPGELTKGADAASAEARAVQREFEAHALEVQADVLRAYWRLWLVRASAEVERDQLALFEGVADVSRGRLETGRAHLADVQQVDLARSRLDDQITGLRELEVQAEARLRATLSVSPDASLPTGEDPPPLRLPNEDEAALRAAVHDHPRLDRWAVRAEARELRVDEARNARAPSFSVGVDWTEVGPARMGGLADSGKDAVMVSVGIELPLWQLNYAEDQKAARAEAAAARSEWAAARDMAWSQLSIAMAQLRDTARRAELHEHTLIPQAETALESTLGGYATGEGNLSAILIAERDLLELHLQQLELEANHAVAWAELERIVGRSVDRHPGDNR